MKFVADLHLHSKYSRAVSQDMVLPKMAQWAKIKGINILATSDFTHPFWFDHLRNELVDTGNGLFQLKSATDKSEVYFMLSCEVSSIYSQGGKGRRIHTLFCFPSLSSVEKFNRELLKRGANLRSDGRPIVGINSRDLAEIALNCDNDALIIPAHIWTPWFSLFGSFSGFDSIEECFGDMSDYIYGIETGLSSDPAMNWSIADLGTRSILSFSDAHSLEKMGREATVFEADKISYDSIYRAIAGKSKKAKVAFTIEFYPEEGKYHFTGHRDCNFSRSPEDTRKEGQICPVCKRPLTVGVMHRVEELKSKISNFKFQISNGVKWIYDSENKRPPYVSLVPLSEIIAEAFGVAPKTKKVYELYIALVEAFGSEFGVLLKASSSDIRKYAPQKVVEGIERVRSRKINIEPGYDGKFGVVKIWGQKSDKGDDDQAESQLNLFM